MVTNDKSDDDGQAPEQSSTISLDEASMESWHAYNDMFESKQRHYDFLQVLENKNKKFNLKPTEADQQKLAEYLSHHDTQVKRFMSLSQQLREEHPESHTLLFKFIGQLGDGEPNSGGPGVGSTTKKVQH